MKKITRRNLEPFLARYATKEKTLDIGAGGSSYSRYFPNRVTLDIDPARKPDIVGDAHALPFPGSSFSSVLCTEVLEHLVDPKKAIGEMKRVLTPGGTLILTTRFVYPIHDAPHDYWRFTKYGLLELFKDWDVVELIPETRAFSTIGVLLQRISFQTKLYLNELAKIPFLIAAWFFDHLNFIIREEYGDIGKKKPETDIMPSGYYLVCKRK
jgi:SAM-dependent methyltransferase